MRCLCIFIVVSVGCFAEPAVVDDNADDEAGTQLDTSATGSTGTQTPESTGPGDADSGDTGTEDGSTEGTDTGEPPATDGPDDTGPPIMCGEMQLPIADPSFEDWPDGLTPASWSWMEGDVSQAPAAQANELALRLVSTKTATAWSISQVIRPPMPFPPGTFTMTADARWEIGEQSTPRFQLRVQDPMGGQPDFPFVNLTGWEVDGSWHALEASLTIEHPTESITLFLSGPEVSGSETLDIDNVYVYFDPTCDD